MTLTGDGKFDERAFRADKLGSLASNSCNAAGGPTSYSVKGQLNDYNDDKILATRRGDTPIEITSSLAQTDLGKHLLKGVSRCSGSLVTARKLRFSGF